MRQSVMYAPQTYLHNVERLLSLTVCVLKPESYGILYVTRAIVLLLALFLFCDIFPRIFWLRYGLSFKRLIDYK